VSIDNAEKPYMGLLGLDRLHPGLKVVNFIVTVIAGIVLAFQSWFYELYSNRAIYHFEPFAWPLLFLFAWPVCAAILWLRFTGLKWRWGILAAILIFTIYFIMSAIFEAIAWMMS
jgi:hypothetical protein